jgi:hypothetical protein
MTKALVDLTTAITQMISRAPTPLPPPASTSPTSIPYGMPGYGGIPPLSNPVAPPIPSPPITTTPAPLPSTSTNLPPPTSALLLPTSTMPIPIHQIAFPHSPSPISGFSEPHHTAYPPQQNHPNQHHHNPPFRTFDGKEGHVGWLSRGESFFYNQGTPEVDKVWMATYYLTGAAQLWSVMLRRDEPTLHWPRFKTLCQQCFGPPLRTNTLGEVARLSFRSTIEDYQDRFLALLCHTEPMPLPHQQAQLFTVRLPCISRWTSNCACPVTCNRSWPSPEHTSAASKARTGACLRSLRVYWLCHPRRQHRRLGQRLLPPPWQHRRSSALPQRK